MKTISLSLLILLPVLAIGQAPLQRTTITTNQTGTNLTWYPSSKLLRLSGTTPSVELWNTSGTANKRRYLMTSASNQLRFIWTQDDDGALQLLGYFDELGNFTVIGYLRLSNTTNQLSVVSGELYLDGVPVVGNSTTPINNFYATNIFVQNGHHNSLVITQALTLNTLTSTLLAADANHVFTNVLVGTGLAYDTTSRTLYPTNLVENQLNLADNTTANASTTKHGFAPKYPNDATKFLDGTGNFTAPASGGQTAGFVIDADYLIRANMTNINQSTSAATNNFLFVGGSSNSNTNGQLLINAVAFGNAATPRGSALAATNRFAILLLPGTYTVTGGALVLSKEFVDLVGISPNTGARVYGDGGLPQGDTVITSTGDTLTINATGNDDIIVQNLCITTSTAGNDAMKMTTTGVRQKCINVFWRNTSALGNHATPLAQTFAGYYEDCRNWNDAAFGYSGTCSGTFIRCKANNEAFSQNGTASGVFIDCEADNGFGGNTASGTFIRCRYVGVSGTGDLFAHRSGATCSGTFIGCVGSGGTRDFGGQGGTMSGTLEHCSNAGGQPAWASVTGRIFGCDFGGWYGVYPMNTADSTQISNTASESNFSLTKSILAGAWKVGRAFKWEAWGKYSSTNVTPGTITFKTKFGATAANTSDALNLPLGGSNLGWKAEGIFTCRTIGGSGTITSASHWEMDQATLGALNESIKPSNGTTTIANNGTLTFQISVTFSAASASNAITLEQFMLLPLDAN